MDPFGNWGGNAASRAQAEASSAQYKAGMAAGELIALRTRVEYLESTLSDLLRSLEADGIITVVSPEAHTRGAETLDEVSDEVKTHYGLD